MTGDKIKRTRYTFESFLVAAPEIAIRVEAWDVDMDDKHADINCAMKGGTRLDFQLVEWLGAEQMRQSVNREAARKEIPRALVTHYPEPAAPLWSASISPVRGIRRPKRSALCSIVQEFGELVRRVGTEWSRHPQRNGPQGYLCRDLNRWPTLRAYFRDIHFNVYMSDPHWVMFVPVGGSYDPRQALVVLCDAVRKKISHYSHPARSPLDLIVHYSRAAVSNTPFYDPEIQGLEDVAQWLAREVPSLLVSRDSCPFQRLFLLDERRPRPVAFVVYPAFWSCD